MMDEMIVTMFVSATDTEPAYTKVIRIEFDSASSMMSAIDDLTGHRGVVNSENLHA